jgi:hypothetical protein
MNQRPLKIGYSSLTDTVFAGRSVNAGRQMWTGKKEDITAEFRRLVGIPDGIRVDDYCRQAGEALCEKGILARKDTP